MKERFINVVKWFFIVLGVLFLAQLLVFSGIIIAFNTTKEPQTMNTKPKELQKIIDYAQKYRYDKGIYPEAVDVKVKKGIEYKYETSDNGNCFSVVMNTKNSQKNYQSCIVEDENSSSSTENYSEYQK